ncbi:MAG: hypothetical protein JOZ14_02650 [Acidobacteria bacterium]|nr:hypothetical protein [Acidobacteriota bacterium]
MPNTNSCPPSVLVVASSFYTAALEPPFLNSLGPRTAEVSLSSIPYNQLHTFLLDPGSAIPEDTPARVVLFLRLEDLIRFELAAGTQGRTAEEAGVLAFRKRSEEFLEVLGRVARLRLAVFMCPSGRGAYDLKFLGNGLRVAEHKIMAELRRQQRHLVIPWTEFEAARMPENCFNPSGDRLGHVPFSPAGLKRVAEFVLAQWERLPVTVLAKRAESTSSALEQFLATLETEIRTAPLAPEDEQQAVNVVRHTTHFVNLPNRKWMEGGIQAMAADRPGGEAWAIRVRDRFGDYGVSGAVTFGMEENVMRVGLLFLSCPVLGRQVEHAVLGWLANVAEQRGAEWIEVPFIAGRDNQVMLKFFKALSREPASGGDQLFRLRVEGLSERAVRQAPCPAIAGTILNSLQVDAVPLSV